MINSTISGVGAYVPVQRVTSKDLMIEVQCEKYGVPINLLEKKIGIIERRWADSSVKPSELAMLASEKALKKSGLQPNDIDQIIFCGMEGDDVEPSTAHRVQVLIGTDNCRCSDVSNACHGFLDGIRDAHNAIRAGDAKNVLVCTGEAGGKRTKAIMQLLKERNLSKEDFMNLMGYFSLGDGGSAVIVTQCEKPVGFEHFLCESRGIFADYCFYDYGPTGIFEGQMIMPNMSGLFSEYLNTMIPDYYASMGWKKKTINNEVDYLVSHQIGKSPHKQLVEITGIDAEKALNSHAYYGNLTSATPAFNLAQIDMDKGKVILIVTAGSGATMTCVVLRC